MMEDLSIYINQVQEKPDTFIMFLIVAILLAGMIDFTFGWSNAKFNKDVQFISGQALYGIIKKMKYFIMAVFFYFVAFLIAPYELAYSSLIVFYIGYLWSEINSIFSHLGITEDGKDGSLFIDLVKNIFKKEWMKC